MTHQDNETTDEYLSTIQRHFKDRLTEWEEGFVESLRQRRAQGRALSSRQCEVLDALIDRLAREHGG